jgi:three-Cys-motif partner protein
MPDQELDEVGYWTEIKLSILRDYSQAYATILHKQQSIKHFSYIDGFAGAGSHKSKRTGDIIDGSPAIALKIQPPFNHYHFIDLDGDRVQMLRQMASGRNDVTVYEGDCNKVLLDEVFPQCRYDQYRRALCVLDPYGLNPDWEVIRKAAEMRSIEIFINFMIMDANMNVLWKDPDKVHPSQITRMNTFWGDDSWKRTSYMKQGTLFDNDIDEKKANIEVAEAYRARLRDVAGFKYVPDPIPMRNSKGAVVYYLVFASHNETGERIAKAIFKKYRNRGIMHGNEEHH